MTLEKLAKAAGVSISTASKAMSGSSEISELTKQKVFDAARRSGCFEKYYKPKYEKYIIAVICPEVKSMFYSSIVTSLETEIAKHGAAMLLSVSNFSAKNTAELIRYYSDFAHANAIIVIGRVPKMRLSEEVPVIAVGQSEPGSNVDCISINMVNAINDAVAYLKECGHTKIAYIGENLTSEKQKQFVDAMHKNALSVYDHFMKVSDKRFEEAGCHCMDMLLSAQKLPTAIIAAYDYIAIGAIRRMRESGFDVPRDFSIIGMDDISTSSYMDIPLTSIRLHIDELCSIALELIFKKIKNKYFTVKQNIIIQSDLVIRSSAAKIK